MKRRMKRNKLLKKVLTLGLVAAVAVSSMAPTLAMMEPVVVKAALESVELEDTLAVSEGGVVYDFSEKGKTGEKELKIGENSDTPGEYKTDIDFLNGYSGRDEDTALCEEVLGKIQAAGCAGCRLKVTVEVSQGSEVGEEGELKVFLYAQGISKPNWLTTESVDIQKGETKNLVLNLADMEETEEIKMLGLRFIAVKGSDHNSKTVKCNIASAKIVNVDLAADTDFKASDYYEIQDSTVDKDGEVVVLMESPSIEKIEVTKKKINGVEIAATADDSGVIWGKYVDNEEMTVEECGTTTISESGKYAVYIKTGELDESLKADNYVEIKDYVKLTDIYVCGEMDGSDIKMTMKNGEEDVDYTAGTPTNKDVEISAEGYTISESYDGTYESDYTFTKPGSDKVEKKILYFQKDGSISAAEVEITFDVTEPEINEVTATEITVNSATVTVSLTEESKENEGEGSITYKLTNIAPAVSEEGHVADVTKTGSATEGAGFSLTGLTKNTDYTFTAVAVDAAGNESESVEVSFVTPKDSMTGDLAFKNGSDGTLAEEDIRIGNTIKIDGITNPSSGITYTWYKVSGGAIEGEALKSEEDNAGESYVLQATDYGYLIKVVASNNDYAPKEKTTEYQVKRKLFDGEGKSISAGEYNSDTRILRFPLTGDNAENVVESGLEYTLDGATTTVKGNAAGSILKVSGAGIELTIPNRVYDSGVIRVRFAETDEMEPGDWVSYDSAISASLEGEVNLTGTFKVGETITASVTGAQDGAELKYQFKKVTNGGIEGELSETNIGSLSTTYTYTLTKEELNCYITVEVTADGYTGKLTLADSGESNSVVQKGAGAAKPTISGNMGEDFANGTWTYTINTIANGRYKMGENGEWGTINAFTGITPNSTVTFYALISGEDEGREDSEVASITVDFPYFTHDKLTLDYSVGPADDGEGKKVTITLDGGLTPSDIEYSFVENGWNDASSSTIEHTYDDALATVTFGIRYKENSAYGPGPMGEVTATVDLSKGLYPAPTGLSFDLLPNSTKTKYIISNLAITTTGGINVEYSLSGNEGTFGSLDAVNATGFGANESVTLYARVAGDNENNPSSIVHVSHTTSSASAAPGITYEDGVVSITGTGDIYLTTNGDEPSVDPAIRYTIGNPIATTSGMVIKAIAVESNKIKSSVTTVTIPSGGSETPGETPDPTPTNPGTGSGSGGSGGSSGGSSSSGGGSGSSGGTGTTPVVPAVTTTADGTTVSLNKDGAYVDKDGKPAANTVIKEPTGVMHITDATGHVVKNSIATTADGKTYVVDADGKVVVSNIAQINGNKYIAGASGQLVKGQFSNISGNTYYSDANGVVKTNGLFTAENKQYVADENGAIVKDKMTTLADGKKVYSGEDGVVVTGKMVTVDGKKYYAAKNGVIATKKIVKAGKKKYYATKTGAIATKKVVKVGNKKYYATKTGALATNKWVKVGNKKYYCNKKGVITKTKKVKK